MNHPVVLVVGCVVSFFLGAASAAMLADGPGPPPPPVERECEHDIGFGERGGDVK